MDSITRVVIGDRDPVQALGTRCGDQIFGTGNTVARKKRMRVEVDVEGHYGNASELSAVIDRRYSLNKLLNGKSRLSGGFFLNTIELVVVQPAIVAGLLEQLRVCADLLDAPRIEYDDLIGR